VPHKFVEREAANGRSCARLGIMATTGRPFERVFTMTDYYDGPRRGIANYDGRPHAYDAPFSYWEARYADLYVLRAVDDEIFRLALEDWEIWLRWEAAFHAGTTTLDTHPALPAERARYDEVARSLDARLAALTSPVIHVRATFRRSVEHTHAPRLEVQWTPVVDATP
jgi:hypothetical protein